MISFKKRKGIFHRIPDFSSDPVTGFGFVFDLYILRTRILYLPYTPIAKLKVNAAYYKNARELVMSLDTLLQRH
jgi:hypothetical protein